MMSRGGGGGVRGECHHSLKAKTREEVVELSSSTIRGVTSRPVEVASIQVSGGHKRRIGEADTGQTVL